MDERREGENAREQQRGWQRAGEEKAEAGLVRQKEERQREREELKNEEVAFISLPVFDQWSMGNRGSADNWSTASEERSFTFLLACSPLLQNHV